MSSLMKMRTSRQAGISPAGISPVGFSPAGFSLVEMLVVVGVITVLIAILIPTIGKVRRAAYISETQMQINNIASACEQYFSDFRAYPGPFANDQLRGGNQRIPGTGFPNGLTRETPRSPGYDPSTLNTGQNNSDFVHITGTENLVLGLLGGLRLPKASELPGSAGMLVYDPTGIGAGPMNLSTGVQYKTYINEANLSWRGGTTGKTGQFADGVSSAEDSIIPEFTDRFPAPLPLLYLRANTGAHLTAASSNIVVGHGVGGPEGIAPSSRGATYDLRDIYAYTGNVATLNSGTGPRAPIGEGKVTPDGSNRQGLSTLSGTPTDWTNAYFYFLDPNSSATAPAPRKKDSFILISAGPDRVYGTKDDITNFGAP